MIIACVQLFHTLKTMDHTDCHCLIASKKIDALNPKSVEEKKTSQALITDFFFAKGCTVFRMYSSFDW